MPIFEAAYSGLPVVAPNWSGHLDFLKAPYTNEKSGKTKWKSLFLKTKCRVDKVNNDAYMKDIIFPESQWAYVDEGHFKKNLRTVLRSNSLYRKDAKVLQEHLKDAYSSSVIDNKIMDVVLGETNNTPENNQPETSVFMA